MRKEIIDDLREIYKGKVPSILFNILIFFLEHIFKHWDKLIEIKTRSDKTGEPLGYFGVFLNGTKRPVVFAGGIEKNPEDVPVPVIRFSNSNPILKYIPSRLIFPYRKNKPGNSNEQNWINVIISDESISMLLSLMVYQIHVSL